MRPPVRIALAVIAVLVLGAVLWLAWGPRTHKPPVLSGYVEGEALYLSAAAPGTLSAVSVERGDRVAAGQPLFVIDAAPLVAQRDQAAAALAAAQARLADASKGQRPTELAVYDAEKAAAEAALRNAQAELSRIRPLVDKGIYAPARLDAASAARDAAAAQVKTIAARKAAGTLGARPDAVQAAAAQVVQARGALAEAQGRLDQISPKAPTAARVQDVFFQTGEWAAANQPVVALLPDDRVRLRFFVPQSEVGRYRPGAQVRFSCDGCASGEATVNYVSPRPEFTPPVIYSRDARQRMVFMVEAKPAAPAALTPGQPVDVEPLP